MKSFLECCTIWAKFNDEVQAYDYRYWKKGRSLPKTCYVYESVGAVLAILGWDEDRDQAITLSGERNYMGRKDIGLMDVPLEDLPKFVSESGSPPVLKGSGDYDLSPRCNNVDSNEFLIWRLKTGVPA